jgi:threonine aldolase
MATQHHSDPRIDSRVDSRIDSRIDLRSDTVTQPCDAMRSAMANAAVGDDVYGDDPSVLALEAFAADLAGHEAAVFAPSGTQTNLLALLSHCQRGDEYIVGQEAHTYRFEGGGAAVLGSIQPQPMHQLPNGTLDLQVVRSHIKPDDSHFARTKLLALENTTNGKVLPIDYLHAAQALAKETGLQFHLDGARVFNAAVASNVPLRDITSLFDSVSLCLSKGLGAPVGSVLVGTAEFIKEARKWRKMLGGGMRQAGVLAAAALYALQHNVDRLAEDHANAAHLANGLVTVPGVTVTSQATNMVFLDVHNAELMPYLQQHGVVVAATYGAVRLVCHKDVNRVDIDRVIELAHAAPSTSNVTSAAY